MKNVRFLMLFVFALIGLAANGESSETKTFREEIDEIFSEFDKEQVPTGILSEYGVALVYPDNFDGGEPNDSNWVDAKTWELLYDGLYDSQINSKSSLPATETVINTIQQKGAAIMCIRYNTIVPDAVEKGLVTIDNDRIKIVPGKNPFEEQVCFAVNLNLSGSRLVFDKENFYTNMSENISKIEYSTDKGQTYRAIGWGNEVILPIISNRDNILMFRMTFSDGSVRMCRCFVPGGEIVKPPVVSNPWKKAAANFAEIPADEDQSGGTIQVMYMTDDIKQFIRPLIIVGDIDVAAIAGGTGVDLNILGNALGEDLELLQQAFDIIYIKYNDSFDDLLRNGEFLRRALKEINSNRFLLSDDSYIIGMGMGGVVARIALNKMEEAGEDHQVQKFIALNSPFRGFNIPVSLQTMIFQATDFMTTAIDKYILKRIKNALTPIRDNLWKIRDLFISKKAIRQLCVYSIDYRREQTTFNNEEHVELFSNELVNKNPTQCETVAISSGNSAFELYYSNSKILKLNLDEMQPENIGRIFYNFNLNMDINCFALPNKGSSGIVYQGYMNTFGKAISFIKIKNLESNIYLNSLPDMYPVDSESGAFLDLNMIKPYLQSFSGVISVDDIFKEDKVCFVPLTSALDIPYGTQSLSNTNVPFDRYYTMDNNYAYTDFAHIVAPLASELAPVVMAEKTSDIFGDIQVFVDNVPAIPGISCTWHFDENKFRIVSQQGLQATIRPLEYGTTDKISATVKLPSYILDFSYTTPKQELATKRIYINGSDYISEEAELYTLSEQLPDSRVEWISSPNIEIEAISETEVTAKIIGNHDEPWIEAQIIVEETDTCRIHKDLYSPELERVEFEIVQSYWDQEALTENYLLKIHHYPENIPEVSLSYCWNNNVVDPNKAGISILGDAKIETEGDTGFCDYVVELDTTITVYPPIVKPASVNNDGLILGAVGPSMAWIRMPSVDVGQVAKGFVWCTVRDLNDISKRDSVYVEAKWSAVPYSVSPNPASTVLTVSEATAPDGMMRSASNVISNESQIRMELYNGQTLVKSLAFDGRQSSMSIDVADLPEDIYYLVIIKNGEAVQREKIVIER